MAFDNDDDDFDFDEPLDAEAENERKKEKDRLRKHPLVLQAKEVLDLVTALLDTCESEEIAEMYGSTLRESAMIVFVKTSSGLAFKSYLLCMQNASLIREHGEYLRLSSHGLRDSGAFDEKYIVMFRQEMEKFRELFKDWAKEIHNMENDFEDEWGLFIK